ncbi:unnamed protein product [Cyclocybe aegerita]|uniref:Uncharacterized protein n=1 Tax=Cyclocybe aegerita TaxID=1973307 RepID=A0A8S0W514_CYCAE|nr:unnamed protein product [Cyclocybe aegerita]
MEGDEVIGAPKHPDWLQMVRIKEGEVPRVIAYVSTRLSRYRPAILEHDLQGLSDHVLICTDLDIGPEPPGSGQQTIKPGSEAEKSFILDILRDLAAIPVAAPATKEGVEALADAIATAFSDAWLAHSTESKPTKHSKSWWTDECSETFGVYQLSCSLADYNKFKKACRDAKRDFFDERIAEIATSHKRPVKELLKDKHVLALFIVLANACLRVGHWPRIFKESLSVIVPKPNKPSYAVPKAFRPIVLLITFEPEVNQGCWIDSDSSRASGFFPSINHEMFMAVLRKQGFSPVLVEFFASYLVGRSTVYCWNTFQSDSRSADVGVGQGSALSPVISGLFIAPPKAFWRYLGFYFDRGLTFQEHVRYYATKAFTTVQAMRMLGNSTRGLSPKQRRLLYRSCVVPIATYAGLIPVHLMLKKLATRAVYRVATLSDTHPLRSMMGEGLLKRAVPHARSAALMTPAMRGKVKSTVMEVDERVHTLTESFEPFAPKARPGDRLLDRYADHLHFDERDPGQDRRPYLDELIVRARADPLTVLAATNGSVPQSNQYQAASAAIIYKGHRELERTRYVSGRVTAPDAELNAISCAVRLAVKQANCQHIMVFTDSMGSAHRAVDPGVHSGQAFSLSVCRVLQEWFEADDLRHITFVYVPSALRWDIHGEAHKYVTELKVRVGRRKTDNSIDTLHSKATHSVLDSWSSTFQHPTYRGSEFLELQQPDGQPLQPSYLNGGPWLSTFGHSITEFAHVCQCMTGHVPIGAYYRRFKINEPHGCTCRAALQSRQHILFRCRDRYSVHYPRFLGDIASFMKYNPTAFGFNRDPSGVG